MQFGLLSVALVGLVQPTTTIELCDAFRSLDRHHGSTISIRGQFHSGLHGSVLAAEGCKTGSTRYSVLDGRAAISLAVPDAKLDGIPASRFRLTSKTFQQYQQLVRLAGEGTEIQVTILGRLWAKKGFKANSTGGDSWIGNGFGFMGRYPAVLVIHEFVESVVRK